MKSLSVKLGLQGDFPTFADFQEGKTKISIKKWFSEFFFFLAIKLIWNIHNLKYLFQWFSELGEKKYTKVLHFRKSGKSQITDTGCNVLY